MNKQADDNSKPSFNLKESYNSLFKAGSIPEIDGFRAIAILLVVITHVSQNFAGLHFIRYNFDWTWPLYSGWIGVDLFFILSGFLVGGQIMCLLDNETFSFSKFYIRRAFRIVPAYYATLGIVLLCLTLWPTLLNASHFDVSWVGFLKNGLFVTDYMPSNLGIGSWSLSVEEQFYLVIPAILFALRKSSMTSKKQVFLFVIIIATIFRILAFALNKHYSFLGSEELVEFNYRTFHARMDALAAGVLIRLYTLNKPQLSAHLLKLLRIAGALGLTLLLFVMGSMSPAFRSNFRFTFVMISFGALVYSTLVSSFGASRCKRILSSKLLTPVAKLSYSIYLTHLFTPYVLQTTIGPSVFWMIALSILVAVPIYLFIEYPIHRWATSRR